MALVTFVGYPSSGKSTRAQELQRLLAVKLAHPSTPPHLAKLQVVMISDESLHISKSAYDDSRTEKPARATLFSAAVRVMRSDTIAIIDAMNYIKGSRYQMYCAAREAGIRTCTVFVATPPNTCQEWNMTREESSRYSEATSVFSRLASSVSGRLLSKDSPHSLENLISRFEEPRSAARWDSPLITIAHFDPPLDPTTAADSSEAASLGSAEGERIWDAITSGDIKPANVATIVVQTSSTSYLTVLENTTTTLIQTLLSQQSLSPLSGPTKLVLPVSLKPITVEITLHRPVSMPQLQRFKRQFSKLNQQAGKELPVEKIGQLFADYLQDGLR
ncbi:BQ5605_C007g04804 [Microbotryum silenes-dioicae]|uniref:BQ5605_C007g04804 protein n=1 Tax=Microbotryum silenes-dioicae TaxID=796604 RepID=A0A2X0MC49_9BASI|nr:BQ5605_C007g04804 [Microbotryum silenes-dioicae]